MKQHRRPFVLLLTLLVVLPSALLAKPVKLTSTTNKGTTVVTTVDSEIKTMSLGNPESGGQLTGIEGLAELTQLESFSVSGTLITNFSFLEGMIHLQYLYLEGVTISDFHFLERLVALERLHLSFRVPPKRFKAVMTEPVNLTKLTKLQFVLALSIDYLGIPPFVNIPSRPYIDLANNGINVLSPRDLALLKQYGAITLRFNPIEFNRSELDKIKGSRLIDRDTPEDILRLYRDFES